ncbi:DUF948 domain-containing protein [Geobacter sp. DSM 9736]|uniref:DUF948 domain-containing protein n=1 Tax=Geobacter sp. DSM 9736 TaxID=1277350 RepID=UPI000B50BEBD|nr:DUF948 domain-containing protein [Geobacter sp. DSM 9736]SNB48038.1 Uncharacterized protein YoxC, contains an MCP-like domain [Geobacter sp. DSM 9736]
MIIINVSVAVAALVLVVLAIVLIRTSIEVRKTAIKARSFMEQLETEVKPVIFELHETLGNLKILTEEAAGKVENVKSFMEAAGDTGRSLQTINTVVKSVTGAVSKSSLWMTGAKVAGKFVLNRFFKKRGN